MKDIKKRRKVGLLIFSLIIVFCTGWVYFSLFFKGNNKFELINKISLTNSYDSQNGYWWGFNQNKLASIDDTVFTFTYDNSYLKNGNSSETNPGICEFYKITEGVKTKFGEAHSNRPCNVLTDKINKKVYYIVSEPVGESLHTQFDFTSKSKAVIYTYSFNESTKEIEFLNYETVISAEQTDGAIIRMGTAINENGDLMIAYGSYDGYILAYTRGADESRWRQYVCLANDKKQSVMYHYAVIVNPEKFYILGLEDYTVNNETYYQYADLFEYENSEDKFADENPIPSSNGYPLYQEVEDNNGWTKTNIIDKQNSDKSNAVRTEDFVLIDGKLNIVIRDKISNKIIHYIYSEEKLIKIKDDFSFSTKMVRIIKYKEKLYYITHEAFIQKIKIIEADTNKTVYRKFISLSFNNGNIYVDRTGGSNINILFISKKADAEIMILN